MTRACIALCALAACTTGATLRQDAVSDSQRHRTRARCWRSFAAHRRELLRAVPETHTEFLQTELDEGDFVRAQKHADVARTNAARALAITDPVQCAEKRVRLIKETPVPQIVRKDSDGDGLFDDEDACPLEPGPVANKGLT